MFDVDVVLLTAVDAEFDQIRNFIYPDGDPSGWISEVKPGERRLLQGTFSRGPDLDPFTVIVAQCDSMGYIEAFELAWEITSRKFPYCLAMCGICAGDPKDCNLGDMIVASEVWRYGPGKVNVREIQGNRVESIKKNLKMESLRPSHWGQDARSFAREFKSEFGRDLQRIYPHPTQFDLKVHVGAVQTVENVTVDDTIFEIARSVDPFRAQFDAAQADKKPTIGLEMEGMGIARVAAKRNIPSWLMIKNVQDHAMAAAGEADKNDKFRLYGASASALFIIEFLRRHLPSNNTKSEIVSRVEVRGSIINRGISGSSSFDLNQGHNSSLLASREGLGQKVLKGTVSSPEQVVLKNRQRAVIRSHLPVREANQNWVKRVFGSSAVEVRVDWFQDEPSGSRLLEKVYFVKHAHRRIYLPIPYKEAERLTVRKAHARLGRAISEEDEFDVYLNYAGFEES